MVSSRFNVVCASNGFAHKKQISFKMDIKRYSYSRYWTGTSLQLRLMRGNNIKKRLMSIAFEKIPCISLSCKLGPVHYREYEYGLFDWHTKPYSYSRYWTGTSLQLRLTRGNVIKKRFMSFAFENTPRISLTCKLVPVKCREYVYCLFNRRR